MTFRTACAALLFAMLAAGPSLGADAADTPADDTTVDIGDDAGKDDANAGSGMEAGNAGEAAPRGPALKAAPFKDLAGRWVGEGRIGATGGKVETVKCRATYFVDAGGSELKQNIRCASAGGKVEVKSDVRAKDGRLSGSWNELVYNLGGDLKGEVTERGFRIVVRGGDLTANMDVIVMNDRQVVEIQFFNSSLRGLTLMLKKG